MEEENLGNAPVVGDGICMRDEVPKHFDWSHCGVTDIYDSQVGQKEVHGCVELTKENYNTNNCQIPKPGCNVNGKKNEEEEGLHPWILRETQKNKFCYCSTIQCHPPPLRI